MSISLIPDSALNEVRLLIGDSEGELIADAVIEYLLTDNDNDVNKVSLKAVDYILKDLAKLKDETVDEVQVKWSQVYDHYVQLKKDLVKDSGISRSAGAFWFGGTSKKSNDKFYNDPDNVGAPIRQGFASDVDVYCYNHDDPFHLKDC